ncbi:MAG: hypothetical protein IPK83_10070 [Planctomycetes bacterium]|nr:hypothetical protein [Planctomycetota bacterium]
MPCDEGESLEAAGKLDEAIREYRKSLEEADALSGKYPDMFEARHDVAQMNSRIGKLCLRLVDTDGALASQSRAVAAFERIVATEPHNARLSLDLAIALDALGQTYQMTQELGRAMEHYRKSLALSEQVLVLEPGMIRAKSVRQTAFCRMGEVELALGDYDKAAHTFDRHLKAAQDILATDPSSPAARREVAVAYYKLAELCRARANRDDVGSATKMNEWRAVHKWLGHCKAEFVALDRDNVIAPSDAGVIGELDGELATAEARLQEPETDE